MSAVDICKKISPMMQIENPITANTSVETIRQIFEAQQRHQFAIARTTASQRIQKLEKLHTAILRRRDEIKAAMLADFQKPPTETDITELGVVLGEIRHTIRHLRSWLTSRSAAATMTLLGTFSEIRYEPKGVCLIISPWNFPFNLTLAPLVSAVAAGNCIVLKPSEYVPNSVEVMKKIIAECFPTDEVAMVEGDAEVSQALLELPFNHVFFTGSPQVGKIVMAAAAKNLASVTLELGGKSPVVVDATADLDNAAAKTIWLKSMNAGQICISPDYVLVEKSVREQFLKKCIEKIEKFYGKTLDERKNCPDYPRLVNHRHFDRVKNLMEEAILEGANVRAGGKYDRDQRFLEPTILENVNPQSRIHSEEIFGPVLPIYEFENLAEAIAEINSRPKALSMYIFSKKNKNIEALLGETRGSGVAINDAGLQFYNQNLPFGGSNNSGIGKTHGEFGFLEFANARGVIRQNRIFPLTNLFLPPYTNRIAAVLKEMVVRWF